MGFGSGMGKRLPVRRLEPSKAYFGGARQCRRPAAARGDKPAWFCASVLRLAFCFNPRPALASGATTPKMETSTKTSVSIRAPLLRAGRPERVFADDRLKRVSIRAPLLRAGRQFQEVLDVRDCGFNPRPALASGATKKTGVKNSQIITFQSAPRSCERGDTYSIAGARVTISFNPRPALASGATAARARARWH